MTAPLLAAALLTQAPPAEPATYQLPYRLTDTKHVLVRVKLNGKGPYNLILDTGAPAVFVPTKLAKEVGLTLGDDGWGRFDQFQVEGGLTVPKVRARVEDLFQLEGMNGMGLAGVELHGVIGYNVLAQFRITYDFTADKLRWVRLDYTPPPLGGGRGGGGQGGLEILGPVMKLLGAFMGITPNFETRPRGFLGFTAADQDGAVVVGDVLPGSPAAAAGLKPGDRLAAVETAAGKRRDVGRLADLDKAVAEAKPGAAVKLHVRRGDAAEMLTATFGKGL